MLVQQSLRVIFDKTKTIKALQPYLDYLTIYRGEHLRYYLPNIEYEKLFKFHLLNLTDRQTLRRGVKML